MSYAVRNTIILLVTLFLIAGSGLGYTKFYLEGEITSLQEEVNRKQQDLNSKQNINNEFTELNERYQTALQVIENYDKALYLSNKPDDVYDFLNTINEDGGNQIFFDFIYSDSIPDNQYGIINSSISGFGEYDALMSFINKIENSQLLNKINDVTISPGRQDDGENSVTFSFGMESYYEKTQLFDSTSLGVRIVENQNLSSFNPLYPLIQSSLPPNEEGLVSVQSARIVGITANRVFLSQGGRVVSLKVGDRVYLGYLSSIDLENKTATFELNLGGIQEVITLEVVR
ncbi:MAG: hypothetical protein JJ971_11305 [Balneolaceae bacterium]|nr:hypothetical protein [Balneolaceae bacterium]MBO6546164.1 hypothetical protein [Balneolaceae bacterium]MBO6648522.1 hypothetical protein [Balneolaceae bacterium]